jgi:acyl-CoA thioesterase
MRFSDVLGTMARDGDRWNAAVDETWLQGRSVFGGVQAALALRAMREHVQGALPLRTMQVTFVAPVPAGPVRLQSRLLRRGGSATQVEARIVDGEATLLLAVGVFGAARESVVVAPPLAVSPRGDLALHMPTVAGYTPAFMQHFGACWRRGGLPASGTRRSAA